MNQYVTRPTLADRPRSPTGNAARDLAAKFSFRVVVFLLLHVPLALALKRSPGLSMAHAFITLAVGLFWLAQDKGPDRLICLTAYVAGAEMLWRETLAFEDIFWEFGKYAVSLLLILAILKQHRLLEADKKPVLYFALLLPSVFVLPVFDRTEIAFNLTGPLSLAVATMFFSTVKLTRIQMERVLFAILAPIVGLAFIASYSTLSVESFAFGSHSIGITAGGFGPNQVSTVLGLGALVAFLYAATGREHGFLRMLMVGCTIWLGAQGALTFSRGGFLAALGAIAVAAFYLLRDRRSRGVFLLRGIGVLLVSLYVVFPALNDFTAGMLAVRYVDFDPTGRDLMIQMDLLAFRQNPLFGVGPGQSKAYHAILIGRVSDTHTELSRMLAEHGSLGLLALFVLLTMSLGPFRKSLPSLEKAYTVSFMVWALLTMLHVAMRLVAPSFAFGLASGTMLSEDATLDYNGEES